MKVAVEVAREMALTMNEERDHVQELFGKGYQLAFMKALSQQGQYAAVETVDKGEKMNKMMTLSQAVGLICNGDSVAVGGNVPHRAPMAVMREIVRQKKTIKNHQNDRSNGCGYSVYGWMCCQCRCGKRQ